MWKIFHIYSGIIINFLYKFVRASAKRLSRIFSYYFKNFQFRIKLFYLFVIIVVVVVVFFHFEFYIYLYLFILYRPVRDNKLHESRENLKKCNGVSNDTEYDSCTRNDFQSINKNFTYSSQNGYGGKGKLYNLIYYFTLRFHLRQTFSQFEIRIF